MLALISWFVTGFVTYIIYCKIFCSINDIKFKLDKKVLIVLALFCCFDCYVHDFYSTKLRILFINLSLILIYKYIYNKNLVKTGLSEIYIFFVFLISEMLFSIIISFLPIKISFFQNNYIGIFLVNLFVILISCFLNKLFYKKVNKMIHWYKENKYVNVIFMIIIIILISLIFAYPISTGTVSGYKFYIYTVIIAFIVIFVYGYFKQKSRSDEIVLKYDNLLNYSKTYEKLVNEKSKNQHEYKNQLLMIRGMIKNNDKKVIKHIDKLLNKNDSDSKHEWLNNLNKIPDSGLKGLICYNLDTATENGLISYVCVSDEISNETIWKVCDDNLSDLSLIIGVYLTNAIEAALECDNKYLIVDVNVIDNDVVFSISNTYKKLPNFNKMDKEGYTTKGKGHGYGLSLVKDILSKNNFFETKTEIDGIYFVKKLIIKNKHLN